MASSSGGARAGSGRTFESTKLKQKGYLTSDDLNPQKARLLSSPARAVTDDASEIRRVFRTYRAMAASSGEGPTGGRRLRDEERRTVLCMFAGIALVSLLNAVVRWQDETFPIVPIPFFRNA